MTQHTPILASESIPVVDDVCIEPSEPSRAEPCDDDPEVIQLGGGYIQIGEYVFYEDWDEIDPPGADDEPAIPHEEVMARFEALLKQPFERAK